MKKKKLINIATIETIMTTTIQVSNETKEKIGSFGKKGDTYEDIIKKLYDIAVRNQLREFLYSSSESISVDEARKRHEKTWST